VKNRREEPEESGGSGRLHTHGSDHQATSATNRPLKYITTPPSAEILRIVICFEALRRHALLSSEFPDCYKGPEERTPSLQGHPALETREGHAVHNHGEQKGAAGMVVSDYSESNIMTSELTIDLGNGPGWLVYPFAASLWWVYS
jgi:hypothetical protein